MKKSAKKTTLSLSACRKLLPIASTGKYVAILCTLFLQQSEMTVLFVISASLAICLLFLDSSLKIAFWKCPHCKKQLPFDFYSRRTMTQCPACGEPLDFSNTSFFVSAPEE